MSLLTPNQILVFQFLTLPFRLQVEVATAMNIIDIDYEKESPDEIWRRLFKEAKRKGVVEVLWDEVEKRSTNPAKFNPYREPDPRFG